MLGIGKLWAMKDRHGLSGFIDLGGCSVVLLDKSRLVITKSDKKDKNGRDYYLVFLAQDDPEYGKEKGNAPVSSDDDIPF